MGGHKTTIDFETRSRVNLKDTGASPYARHESTSILCIAVDDLLGSRVWIPRDNSGISRFRDPGPPPEGLLEHIEDGGLIYAHNVFFERNIWHHICHLVWGWPDVPFENWRCTAAACARLAMPRSLEMAGQVAGLPVQKDKAGHRVMLQMCKPRKPTKNNPSEWVDDPDKREILYSYGKTDGQTQGLLAEAVPELTDYELRVWQLDQKINLHGIPVDLPAVENALAIVDQCYEIGCLRLLELTDGNVETPGQDKRIKEWSESQGLTLPNLQAETVTKILDNWGGEKDAVHEVLSIRQALAKSSTKKLRAIKLRADEDGRVREILMYHGAHTGRWAGIGIQIQNFPRGTFPKKLARQLVQMVLDLLPSRDPELIDMIVASPLDALSNCMRAFIRAEPGYILRVSDFTGIEPRVLAWLSGCQRLLQIFAEGGDPYKDLASSIYEIDVEEVDDNQRHVGKTGILGLGYGMGKGKKADSTVGFLGSLKKNGIKADLKFSGLVVTTYRENYSEVPRFWYLVNQACIDAIETGEVQDVNGLLEVFIEGKDDLGEPLWLKIKLPSGRCLHYWNPRVVDVRAPWSEGHRGRIKATEDQREWLENLDIKLGENLGGWFVGCNVPKGIHKRLLMTFGASALQLHPKTPQYIQQMEYWGVHPKTKRWGLMRTYGAKLTENIVQGVARDFLVEAMFRAEGEGYTICGTVHDEIVSHDLVTFGSLEEFNDVMEQKPDWGLDCPGGAEGYEAERYRK